MSKPAPLPTFPKRCQVAPQILRGIDDHCPLAVRFHHEILLADGVGARSASCAAHLFEAAAGLLKAIMQAGVDPERVRSINVTQVADSGIAAGDLSKPGRV